MNFHDTTLNWILNWINCGRNSNIELNQFGYRTGLGKSGNSGEFGDPGKSGISGEFGDSGEFGNSGESGVIWYSWSP